MFFLLDLLCLNQKDTLLHFSLVTMIWPCGSLLPWLLFPKPLLFVVIPLVQSLCPSRSRVGMYLTHGPWWSPLQAISTQHQPEIAANAKTEVLILKAALTWINKSAPVVSH